MISSEAEFALTHYHDFSDPKNGRGTHDSADVMPALQIAQQDERSRGAVWSGHDHHQPQRTRILDPKSFIRTLLEHFLVLSCILQEESLLGHKTELKQIAKRS